jgi:hypothetical protein
MASSYDTLSPEVQSIICKDTFLLIYNEILSLYDSVPYHSSSHGIDVLETGFHFLRETGNLPDEPINIITLIFALLGHDAGHPGLGNQERIKTIKETLNVSCLEEYHYQLTKSILQKHSIPFNDELLHQSILATNSLIPATNTLEYLIKLADINHSVSSLEKHLIWSSKIQEEITHSSNSPNPIEQIEFLEKTIGILMEKVRPFLEESSSSLYERLSVNLSRNLEYWKSH